MEVHISGCMAGAAGYMMITNSNALKAAQSELESARQAQKVAEESGRTAEQRVLEALQIVYQSCTSEINF